MSGDESWREELRRRTRGTILFDERADRHTSIGVGGRIDAIVFPADEPGLAETVDYLRRQGIPFLPLGNGTNLVVTDRGYRGVLVSLAALHRTSLREEAAGIIDLDAQAGVPLAELVGLCTYESLTGMEFCAGIPGTVGGALRMNAGAYGVEMKDIVSSLSLLVPVYGIRNVRRDELIFSYRNLDLPAETIIIGATFRLHRGEGATIAGRVREIMGLRREKHPLEFPSAGSIFKNPPAVPAGKLIEQAGLKGMRIGNAEVSEKHGNFIVNRGGATADEILGLIALIQRRVFEATGQRLETEVKIIGE